MDAPTRTAPFATEQLLSSDFQTAARAVLAYLRDRLGFGLWMVTRTSGDDWIVLTAEDRDYGVAAGDLFRWSDSFCSQMVIGLGPRVAPDSAQVPAYAAAPIGRQVTIGAYVGVPIFAGGEMFGTLCAINQTPMPASIIEDQPLVELLAGLLGNILIRERAADAERRLRERAEVESMTDALTGLLNRRGWESLLEREEERCRRYGDPATIAVVDLDGLKRVNDFAGHAEGDRLIKRAAAALRVATRSTDVVARLGGDEFGLILVGSADEAAELDRINSVLHGASVDASVGVCGRHPSRGLTDALAEADSRMLAAKRARWGARSTSAPTRARRTA